MRDEGFAEQREAIPHRFCSVDTHDGIRIVYRFKSAQARRQHARSRAVSGIDECVLGEKIAEDGIPAAAAQRVTEHEHVAAAYPGQRKPGQIMTKAIAILKVVAEIQLGSVESSLS